MSKRGKCIKSGKFRFRTFDEANQRMKVIQRKPRASVPVRVYPCEFCNGFHLTKSMGYVKETEVKMKSAFEKFIQKEEEI